jgi:hypothetical protein
MLILAFLALLSPDGPPRLLDSAADFVGEFWRTFRQYVARESETQTLFDRSGRVEKTRTITADYYFVSSPTSPGTAYEFREVLTVDGKRVQRSNADLRKLLSEGGGFEAEYRRLHKESNKYNLMGSGTLSNAAVMLPAYVSRSAQKYITYRFAGQSGSDYVYDFAENAGKSLLRQGRAGAPLPAAGRVRIASDGSVTAIEATVALQGDVPASRIRYAVEYSRVRGDVMPVRRFINIHREGWPNNLRYESVATYGEFRRFGAESTITVP